MYFFLGFFKSYAYWNTCIQKNFQDFEKQFSVLTIDIPKLFSFGEEQNEVVGSLVDP